MQEKQHSIGIMIPKKRQQNELQQDGLLEAEDDHCVRACPRREMGDGGDDEHVDDDLNEETWHVKVIVVSSQTT